MFYYYYYCLSGIIIALQKLVHFPPQLGDRVDPSYHIGGLLCDHDGRYVGFASGYRGHDTGVHRMESLDAFNSETNPDNPVFKGTTSQTLFCYLQKLSIYVKLQNRRGPIANVVITCGLINCICFLFMSSLASFSSVWCIYVL